MLTDIMARFRQRQFCLMTPQCDIILPVHDALEFTQKCVESIFQHTQNFRLIIVDDFSQPETTAYLMGVLARQRISLYVRTAQQKWWTRASNIGLRLVRTPRAVLINSDCVVDAGWLEELFAVWDEASKAGLRVGLVGSTFSQEEPRRWADIREPGYVTGHCLLLSLDALFDISSRRGQPGIYLDEVQQISMHIRSDMFASFEMNRAGWATVASMKAAVGHHGGKSWGYDLCKVSSLRIGDPLKGEVLG